MAIKKRVKKNISKSIKKSRKVTESIKKSRKVTRKVKKTNRKTKKIVKSDDKDDNRVWKKITITIGYKPHNKSFDVEEHLKKYTGKVVLWDFFSKLRSMDFDKIKIKDDKLIFHVALDALKAEYGTTSDVLIKKCINDFNPSESTKHDKISSFWKIVNMQGEDKFHLFVKKVSVSKN